MNEDAAQAVLGLLGLSPHNLPPPPPPPPPSLIPLKRKQSCSDPADTERRKQEDVNADSIRCICGFTFDDGFSIACDECSRWCHAACFSIVDGEVPEEWYCWECVPRQVDRDRAVALQQERERQRQAHEMWLVSNGRGSSHQTGSRRKTSPGVERKPRSRVNTADASNGGGGGNAKRKRRASTAVPPSPVISQPPPPGQEDEHVDVVEPWTSSYVHISHDIYHSQDARDHLRQYSSQWRGITALSPYEDPTAPAFLPEIPPHPRTAIHPIPSSSFDAPYLSVNADPSILPPAYAMHTTVPISSRQFIAPYTSAIAPSSTYLSDPLNGYAHLGMPKPYVHLIGPPLDVSLDSRITGDESRFVRSGCKPNAVLRPVICPQAQASSSKPPDGDKEEGTPLSFGVFSLRDLKANEEVVLGWEWDDGHAVHSLPALLSCPDMFPPNHIMHMRRQMSNILHALGSTFTTCACGAKARDCAVAQMAAFVDQQENVPPQASSSKVDMGPLIGNKRGFKTREKVPWSGGMSGIEMVDVKGKGKAVELEVDIEGEDTEVPHLRSRAPVPDENRSFPHRHYILNGRHINSPVPQSQLHPRQDEGGGVMDLDDDESTEVEEEDEDEDEALSEDDVPPKLRKRWMKQTASSTSTTSRPQTITEDRMDVDVEDDDTPVPSPSLPGRRLSRQSRGDMSNAKAMPPPPMPASLDPTTVSSKKVLQLYNTNPPGSPPANSSRQLSLHEHFLQHNQLHQHQHQHQHQHPLEAAAISPSIPFANLSLSSPGGFFSPPSFLFEGEGEGVGEGESPFVFGASASELNRSTIGLSPLPPAPVSPTSMVTTSLPPPPQDHRAVRFASPQASLTDVDIPSDSRTADGNRDVMASSPSPPLLHRPDDHSPVSPTPASPSPPPASSKTSSPEPETETEHEHEADGDAAMLLSSGAPMMHHHPDPVDDEPEGSMDVLDDVAAPVPLSSPIIHDDAAPGVHPTEHDMPKIQLESPSQPPPPPDQIPPPSSIAAVDIIPSSESVDEHPASAPVIIEERPPTPLPAPPRAKLSLQDYMKRKRKQIEEIESLLAAVNPTPTHATEINSPFSPKNDILPVPDGADANEDGATTSTAVDDVGAEVKKVEDQGTISTPVQKVVYVNGKGSTAKLKQDIGQDDRMAGIERTTDIRGDVQMNGRDIKVPLTVLPLSNGHVHLSSSASASPTTVPRTEVMDEVASPPVASASLKTGQSTLPLHAKAEMLEETLPSSELPNQIRQTSAVVDYSVNSTPTSTPEPAPLSIPAITAVSQSIKHPLPAKPLRISPVPPSKPRNHHLTHSRRGSEEDGEITGSSNAPSSSSSSSVSSSFGGHPSMSTPKQKLPSHFTASGPRGIPPTQPRSFSSLNQQVSPSLPPSNPVQRRMSTGGAISPPPRAHVANPTPGGGGQAYRVPPSGPRALRNGGPYPNFPSGGRVGGGGGGNNGSHYIPRGDRWAANPPAAPRGSGGNVGRAR